MPPSPGRLNARKLRAAIAARIDAHADAIEMLVALLDLLDGDCDLEAGGDEEPWLGWIGNGPGQYQSNDDREIDESGVAR